MDDTNSNSSSNIHKPPTTRPPLKLISHLAIALLASTCARCVTAQAEVTNQDRRPVVAGLPIWLMDQTNATGQRSSRLEEILARVGPNMRASADYRDFRDVQLNESLEAWRELRERVGEFARQQVDLFEPRVSQLLEQSNVSSACLQASERVLASIRRLDSWAVRMWSYSGTFPPAGHLDGQFSDLGFYGGCVDIVGPAPVATRPTSYCVVGFRPIVPARPRFHLVFNEEPRELLRLFNASDLFASMAHRAQYSHYIYWKTGLCVPSECSPLDIQQVARLVGRNLALQAAPVRCYTRSHQAVVVDANQTTASDDELDELENTKPVLIQLNRSMNRKQWISLLVIGSYFLLVLLATLWHGLELAWQWLTATSRSLDDMDDMDDHYDLENGRNRKQQRHDANNHQMAVVSSNGPSITKSFHFQGPTKTVTTSGAAQCKETAFYYLSMITNGREFFDVSMRANEIECLHGLRAVGMIWIICVHALQYNDWSGFTRVYENVPSLQNPFVHPLINANYVVDNFFLMSGLLAAYTTWHNNKGARSTHFSIVHSLLGRYLRLTPQVLLLSLAYMLLPLVADGGPFWFDMTHYAAKYCEKNWWVNLLHAQAFYREDEMCNLVGWWISVDMYYYVLGLVLLWLMLKNRVRLALTLTGLFVAYCTLITGWRHYSGGFSPNNLGLVPQVNEVWSEFVVSFFWSPYPHAVVFFLGLWLGYLLANKMALHLVRRHSRLGWLLALTSLLVVNMSSRLWNTGTVAMSPGKQWLSTAYNLVCVVLWAASFGWMIVACHYGCASKSLNRFLSNKFFLMVSKASFIIYLSHMLLLRTFFGTRYELLEVSIGTVTLLMVGMSFVSILFGVFLCIAFESPFMKLQRLIMKMVKPGRSLPVAGSQYGPVPINYINNNNNNNNNSSSKDHDSVSNGATSKSENISLNLSPASAALLK